MKKILFVASECKPFVKTGGLADVVGSLPQAFDKKEYDIRVMIPNYEKIDWSFREKMETIYYFQLDNRIYVGVKRLVYDGITYYFIDNNQYFSGNQIYFDMFSDLERYAYFSKACLSCLPLIDFRPDIIHVHDWQASLVPVYLNTVFQGDSFFQGIKTVMTLHNLRFQGTWDVPHIRWVSGLPEECFDKARLVSPFEPDWKTRDQWTASMLRGGIVYSDYITTVSNSYAREIQTPEFAEGLEDILVCRNQRLWGIVNGLDYREWNPDLDDIIYKKYNTKTLKKGKIENKLALQRRLGLKEDENVFTLAIVSRLTDQKGLDLIDRIMERLCDMEVNIIVLGTGDAYYENMFRYYKDKYPNKVRAEIYYSEELAHQIYASASALLVPSAFEPCGLTQLIALKYGTVPIVHEIGGLKDTVKPYNWQDQSGTGFSFSTYNANDLLERIYHAAHVYYNEKDNWYNMLYRGMKEDWSWANSCNIYKDLYSRI